MRECGCPVDYSDLSGTGPLTPGERRHLEQKLSRLLEWVGVWIPDSVILEGQIVPLHETIWRLIKKDRLTPEEEALVLDLEEKLDKKFKEDLENIGERDLSESQASRDYCEAAGLLRAIGTLKEIGAQKKGSADRGELIDSLNEAKKEKARRWLEFIKQVRET